jgi:hypothetical protein
MFFHTLQIYMNVINEHHKMSETHWGLNTSPGDNKLRLATPTQTHIFDNRSNGYDRLSIAHMRSSVSR